MSTTTIKLFPVQAQPRNRQGGSAREEVYLRAYEVYCAVYGPQPAMIDIEGRNCRGGFSSGEIIAFLYAHSFPEEEWRARVSEAFEGLNV